MSWVIDVPLVAPSLNPWQRMFWRDQALIRDEWHKAIWVLCREQSIPLLEKIDLDISIYYGCNRKHDWDNGAPAFKLVQDGLVKAGVLVDDDISHIARPMFPAILYDRKNPRTLITITSV